MAIKKQEFYEGAALHMLARAGGIAGIRYEPPFFVLNGTLIVHLKYSTSGRSPWGFTFVMDEQALIQRRASGQVLVIGLICGSDGVAVVTYDEYLRVAPIRGTAVHIACRRKHGQHYEVSGPEGSLDRKVPPSNWRRLLAEVSR